VLKEKYQEYFSQGFYRQKLVVSLIKLSFQKKVCVEICVIFWLIIFGMTITLRIIKD